MLLLRAKQGQEGSSLTNLHFFAYLFGLDIRNLQDGHLHALIRDQGVSKGTKDYLVGLKALHLAHDVASTFLSGAHVGSATAESMVKERETITTSLRVETQEGGKDAEEGKEVAEEEKEADAGGRKGAGASIGRAEKGKHSNAEPVLEWKLQQIQFACSFAELLSSPDDRRAISSHEYVGDGMIFRGKAEGEPGGVLDWIDLFYHGVFRQSLANANSLGLTRAQGRLATENPRYSNKSNFQMGAGEVPHPSVWAHPYRFDALTTYEFVSTRPKKEQKAQMNKQKRRRA